MSKNNPLLKAVKALLELPPDAEFAYLVGSLQMGPLRQKGVEERLKEVRAGLCDLEEVLEAEASRNLTSPMAELVCPTCGTELIVVPLLEPQRYVAVCPKCEILVASLSSSGLER